MQKKTVEEEQMKKDVRPIENKKENGRRKSSRINNNIKCEWFK